MGGGITLNHFLVLSLIVFSLGLFTVLTRRNAIGILMGVELILNSANINYLAFSFYGGGKYDGQIFAIFVIMLAAAEAVMDWRWCWRFIRTSKRLTSMRPSRCVDS